MNICKTELDGVVIIEPAVFGDSRGYFFESYNAIKFREQGLDANFVQDNESKSRYGVLRGLHFQKAPYAQAKLVRAVTGRVLDVVVDIRRGSPTFGRHVAVELSGENKRQLFVPRGFAHGFVVLSPEVVMAYKCDNIYMPSHERGVSFRDPALGIDWQVPQEELILSPKDLQNPPLEEAEVFAYDNQEYLK